VLQIGAPVPLHGVMTRPATSAVPFALVILNAGMLHHVGSCGFSVRLARAAAETGVPALRYDTSGVGDSPARPSALPHDRRSVVELREVLDTMQQRLGVDRFVLMGLCSGAFTAFDAALGDDRIIGMTQVAPFSYRTSEWYARHYAPRVLAYDTWKRYIARKVGAEAPKPAGLDEQYLETYDAGWSVPPQSVVEEGYRTLLARRVHLFNIMTGGEADTYLYEGQFRDMFPSVEFGERFTEWYLPEAAHTITRPDHQRLVLTRIVRWLSDIARSG
jgi:pimeloyl-ACP methyl ester carboxylesterase